MAYVGGIDLAPDRWDTRDHVGDKRRSPERFAGWHDIHVRITGPATGEVADSFRERWNEACAPSRFRSWLLRTSRPAPLISRSNSFSDDGREAVQVLRTYSSRSRLRRTYPSFAPRGERSYLHAYLKAISQAKRYIYIEDQYFSSLEIASALAQALTSITKLIIVIPADVESAPRFIQESMRWRGSEALRRLRLAGNSKVSVYHLTRSMSQEMIWVHSKVLIIDDEYAAIGSANLNRRSMTYDSELGVAVVSTGEKANGFAADLRRRLWSEHLGVSVDGEALADPVEAASLWDARARAPGGRVQHHMPAPGRPHRALWNLIVDPQGSSESRTP